MSKKWLYHEEKCPKGKIFDQNYIKSNEDNLKNEGWVESPAEFEKKAEAPPLTRERVNQVSPDELVSLVKGMGFIVLTEEQFEAELAKVSSTHTGEEASPPQNFNETSKDNDQAEEPDTFDAQLIDQFEDDPESLTKDELIELGNKMFDLNLSKQMKESTLISKIQEARG